MRCLLNTLFALFLFVLFAQVLLVHEPPPQDKNTPPDNNKGNAMPEVRREQLPPAPLLPHLEIRTEQGNWVEKIWRALFPSTYPGARQLMRAAEYDASFVRLARQELNPAHSGELNLGQVCDLFDYLFENRVIVKDPLNTEYFCTPREYWLGHSGDCDDMAICMTAACNAIGAVGRITIAYGSTGHAYAELCLGNGDIGPYLRYLYQRYGQTNPIYHKDKNGYYWLNLDLNHPHPGGAHFDGERYFYYYPSVRRWIDLKN